MPDDNKGDAGDKDKGSGGDKGSNDQLAAIQKENADLKSRLEEFTKKATKDEKTLNDKVKESSDEKAKMVVLESALKFNIQSADFLKTNGAYLPNEVVDIFKEAEKESYDSPVQKASATKAALIQSFFKVQANIDFLTPTQKSALEDYFKLTKNGKEERSQHIFENIFEPSLEMIKRVKKAEEVARAKSGHGNPSDVEKAYKEKLMSGSKKHYLGEKSNA